MNAFYVFPCWREFKAKFKNKQAREAKENIGSQREAVRHLLRFLLQDKNDRDQGLDRDRFSIEDGQGIEPLAYGLLDGMSRIFFRRIFALYMLSAILRLCPITPIDNPMANQKKWAICV